MLIIQDVITNDETEAFMWGDCYLLARAMHNITGWTMVSVGGWADRQRGDLRNWIHMAVRTPDGMILDIQGFHTDLEIEQDWDEEFTRMSTETDAYADPDVDSPELEIFDITVEEWAGMTNEQVQSYTEIDPSLTAHKLLAYYIEFQIAVKNELLAA